MKAKTQDSRKKTSDSGIFDNEGLIYTRIADTGEKLNAGIVLDALKRILKRLLPKRPAFLDSGDCSFHWDNVCPHCSIGQEFFFYQKQHQDDRTSPLQTRSGPQRTFFLFTKVKSLLAGQHPDDAKVKTGWDGVTGCISDEDCMGAFVAWMHRIERCFQKDGNFVKK